MAKTLGYLITWTTYGTWLQGDRRRYVKDGQICPPNENLLQVNRDLQIQDVVKLSKAHQNIVRQAIIEEAALQKQHICALSVKSSHIHIVVEYIPQPIDKLVAHYKSAARIALKAVGHTGKLWTKGYDKRFCFDKRTFEQKIKYVQNHNK